MTSDSVVNDSQRNLFCQRSERTRMQWRA